MDVSLRGLSPEVEYRRLLEDGTKQPSENLT
jgi:hypothetical protein